VAASIGIAALVVVMSNQAKDYLHDLGPAVTSESAKFATIYGINHAFFVSAIISAIALFLSFFFKRPKLEQTSCEKEILAFE
jgi:hypothetical protein